MDGGDFNCDFNAPMFVDFHNEDADATNPESYFEIDHEAAQEAAGGVAVAATEEDVVDGATALPTKEETDGESEVEGATALPVEKEAAKPVYNNIVASWADGARRRPPPTSTARPETPTRNALRKAVAETVAAITNSPKIKLPELGARPKRLGTNLGGQPRLGGAEAKPQQHLSPGVSRWQKAVNMLTPELLRNAREERQQKRRAAATETGNEIRLTSTAAGPSSTAAPNTFRDKLRAKRNIGKPEIALLPVKAGPLPVVKPTEPQPFKFATDARMKAAAADPKSDSSNQVDYLKMLRQYKPSATAAPSGPTQVKPFNRQLRLFGTSLNPRARSADPSQGRNSGAGPSSGAASKFVSTAEMLRKFQTSTPDRFHSQPRGRSESAGRIARRRSPSPQITRAQTPNLMTRGRSRTGHVLSRERLEELALEEAKKNQFRASAINAGVKPFKPVELEKRAPTQPQPFNLTEHTRRTATSEEAPTAEFRARPVPRKIFEGPVGIPERRPAAIVEPQSPAFVLRDRLTNRKRAASVGEVQEEEVDRVFRAKPAPHFGIPVILESTNTSNKRVTTVEPFSFANRDLAMMERKQQKIAAIEEEEKKQREFKANPLPDPRRPVNLPPKEVILPTKLEPFDLQIEKRVGDRLQKWQEDVSKQQEEQREAVKFHARPAAVLEREPFIPKPSEKPLAEVSNFELHSDRRAREREEYDQQRKQKEAEMEGMKRQQEEKRRQEEERELQRLRREAVHKPQPFKQSRPFVVQPSNKPITTPVTPKFSALSRERKAANATQSSSDNGINDTYDA